MQCKVEDVHMELFIAMVFVFMGMTFTIHRTLKYQASSLDAVRTMRTV